MTVRRRLAAAMAAVLLLAALPGIADLPLHPPLSSPSPPLPPLPTVMGALHP